MKCTGATLLVMVLVACAVCAQDYVPVDREISDEDVLRLIDSDYPGLEGVAEALDAGDVDAGLAILVSHFATRERPVLPAPEFPGVTEGNSMIVLRGSAADKGTADEKWLNHIFSIPNNDIGEVETFQIDAIIRWMESPSKALNWTGYLNQLNIISRLAGVYKETGDEKYTEEAGDMLVSWVQQVHRSYGYTLKGRYVDSGMEVRNRLCNCIAAYEVLRKSSSLTPPMHMAFWKLFITCCRELMTYEGVSYPGLIPAAVMYPEFGEWREWLESGKADLEKHLVDRVTPEGAWDTHSISYQTVPVPWAGRSLEFLQANDDGREFGEISGLVVEQAGKLLELMLRIAMPNGALPNIGDTYGRTDWNAGAIIPRLESYIHLRMSPEEKARLEAIEDPYSRLKATLAVADGTNADQPSSASMAFPGTGYYVMRAGWEPQSAPYLYFDLSAQAMGHAHNDAGHFELYAYGKPLLADAGDYFLGWGYRTALHNAVEVDGQQQVRGAQALMEPHEWLSTPAFDFVDGAHQGYAELGVRHRRSILFIKPDYAIVSDLLTGDGSHTFEQFFHFAGPAQSRGATATIDARTLGAATAHEGVANVQVVPVTRAGLRAELVPAQDTDMSPEAKQERAAMLGWIVTGGSFQRAKSAVVSYVREGNCPQAFHDVLFPTPPGTDAQLAVESLPVIQNGAAVPDTEAVCIEVDCAIDAPAHGPDSIRLDLGENLGLGRKATGEISATTLSSGVERITDGELGPRKVAAALSSYPYSPGVELAGRFGVELGQGVEINTVVAHHGTWNGQKILYAPEKMTVQYWSGGEWRDVADAETVWGADEVTTTHFTPVTTDRVSIKVERAAGGRLALRELQVYRVADADVTRVERLRQARTTSRWTDTIMVSHGPGGMRSYGDFEFDGELAVVRRSEDGQFSKLMLKRGSTVRHRGSDIVTAAATMDWLGIRWEDGTIDIDGPCRPAMSVRAQGSTAVRVAGDLVTGNAIGGALGIAPTVSPGAPRITDLRVVQRPAQPGLAGGQPWAMVAWKTDQPSTTQVEFGSGGQLDRRTILDARLVTEHEARVEFLLPDEAYRFRARSVGPAGGTAEEETTGTDG